jgi:hypothetical protein
LHLAVDVLLLFINKETYMTFILNFNLGCLLLILGMSAVAIGGLIAEFTLEFTKEKLQPILEE